MLKTVSLGFADARGARLDGGSNSESEFRTAWPGASSAAGSTFAVCQAMLKSLVAVPRSKALLSYAMAPVLDKQRDERTNAQLPE